MSVFILKRGGYTQQSVDHDANVASNKKRMAELRKAGHVKLAQLMVPIRATFEASAEIDAAIVRQTEIEDALTRLEQKLEHVRAPLFVCPSLLMCARRIAANSARLSASWKRARLAWRRQHRPWRWPKWRPRRCVR